MVIFDVVELPIVVCGAMVRVLTYEAPLLVMVVVTVVDSVYTGAAESVTTLVYT